MGGSPGLGEHGVAIGTAEHPVTKTEIISQAIHDALRDRCLLHLNYRHLSRVVQPRAIDSDDGGHVVLVALQLSGGRESAEPVGVQRFRIAEIDGASVLSSDSNG